MYIIPHRCTKIIGIIENQKNIGENGSLMIGITPRISTPINRKAITLCLLILGGWKLFMYDNISF